MSSGFAYGAMALDEVDVVGALVERSFAMERDYVDRLARLYGPDAYRVMRGDRGVAACLARFVAPQWFGGRLVSSSGIAVVAVEPESRGRGLSTALLRATLRELRGEGVALSSLFPSTYGVYRKVGYEIGGSRCVYAVAPDSIQERVDPAIELVPSPTNDWDLLQRFHESRAATMNGAWERPELLWRKMLVPYRGAANATLARADDGAIEGYAIALRDGAALRFPDLAASTQRAARSLLAFIGAHRSTMSEATWAGGPEDLLALKGAPSVRATAKRYPWMLRVVDVRAALESRGYAAPVEASLSFELRDDVLSENAGVWTLDVAGGAGELREGGDGQLKLDVRALAALYGGELGSTELRALGLLEGPRESDALADLIFAGPRAWMADDF